MSVKDITVAATGVAQGFAAGARRRIAPVVLGTDALVENVRVRLTALGEPARAVIAQVVAEVDGRRVRVQRSAAGVGGAVERAADALRARIAEVSGPWRPRPWPEGPRGLGILRSARLGSGTISRVKAPALVWCSPETAARTMDAMDYDIHLFVDPATETEAAVYRVGPTGYRLARTVSAGPPAADHGIPWTLNPGCAPRLTDAAALDRVARAELPHLFYADPETGSGRVLYRRLDGNYAVITAPRGTA